jgi:hypothetical protein
MSNGHMTNIVKHYTILIFSQRPTQNIKNYKEAPSQQYW